MIKKALVFAVCLFAGGNLFAEPVVNGPRDPARMKIWQSSAPYWGTANKITNSAMIHQVIVSSHADVDYSTDSVLSVYGSMDGTGDRLFRVQVSTTETTSQLLKRWTFDIYASSGLSYAYSTGTAGAGDVAGNLQILYKKGPPEGFNVWQSSFMPSDTSTHTLAKGPVLLHKVIVLKAATGTSPLRIHNAYSSSPANQIAQIDLTAGAREYDFDIMLSSGLTTNIEQNGTISADVMFLYKKNPSRDMEYWTPFFSSATVTTAVISYGRNVFGGVLNGDNVTDSQLTVYDSSGTTSNQIAKIDGGSVFDFDEANYEIQTSSGITLSCVGNGMYTIRYRRLR